MTDIIEKLKEAVMAMRRAHEALINYNAGDYTEHPRYDEIDRLLDEIAGEADLLL